MSRASLLLALCLLPHPGDESLEDFLRAARERWNSTREVLRLEVSQAAERIEASLLIPDESTQEAEVKRVIALGSEAAPLIVPYLDPGPQQEKSFSARVRRARVMAQALEELVSPAVTKPLLDLFASGSARGRRNALTVLAHSPDRERIVPRLSDAYATAPPELRKPILTTLATLGGPLAEKLLLSALESSDPEEVDGALQALVESESPPILSGVLAFAASPRAASHLKALGAFYLRHHELLDDAENAIALLKTIASPQASPDDATALLEALASLRLNIRSKVRRAMGGLLEHPSQSVRRATLILLARAGDKTARRDLLAPYNDAVAQDRKNAGAYLDRADTWYQIADYGEAIKDYKQAIKLNQGRRREAEPFLGLARCYARLKKYKEAKVQLELAPVSIMTLRKLAEDPAFEQMLETRYATVFQLDGGR